MKTTSYKISKKLKEAGFEAETDFYFHGQQLRNLTFPRHIADADGKGNVKAYDLETILDALKQTGKRIMIVVKSDIWGINFNYEFNIYSKENESLADTAGKMWLLLKEKGLV